MKKRIVVFFVIFFSVCFILNNTYAVNAANAVNISILDNYSWTNPAKTQTNDIGGAIIAIMQVVGVSIATIMLIGIAIKYMTSAPNDRAEIKKHMIPYIIGAVFIFAATAIVGIIKNFMGV